MIQLINELIEIIENGNKQEMYIKSENKYTIEKVNNIEEVDQFERDEIIFITKIPNRDLVIIHGLYIRGNLEHWFEKNIFFIHFELNGVDFYLISKKEYDKKEEKIKEYLYW